MPDIKHPIHQGPWQDGDVVYLKYCNRIALRYETQEDQDDQWGLRTSGGRFLDLVSDKYVAANGPVLLVRDGEVQL